MGPKQHHSAQWEYECDKCKSRIEVEYDVWEYPAGIKNHQEIKVEGGTVIQECDIDIQAD